MSFMQNKDDSYGKKTSYLSTYINNKESISDIESPRKLKVFLKKLDIDAEIADKMQTNDINVVNDEKSKSNNSVETNEENKEKVSFFLHATHNKHFLCVLYEDSLYGVCESPYLLE